MVLDRAKKYTSTIVLVGLATIPKFIQWSDKETYELKDVQKYDEILKSVCKEYKVHFIEIFNEFKKLNYKKLLQDELHYSTKGHKKFYEIIKNYLTKNNII